MFEERSMQTISDQELLVAAKSGIGWAAAELCSRHRQMAFSMIYRILKNHEDAEDAYQESTLKVYLHIEKFDEQSKFSSWFSRIAINCALTIVRSKSRRPQESLDELVEGESSRQKPLVSLQPSPEAIVLHSEFSSILKDHVNELPIPLRDITLLRYTQDLSMTELASLAGISLSATKTRLLRGRTRLIEGVRSKYAQRAIALP